MESTDQGVEEPAWSHWVLVSFADKRENTATTIKKKNKNENKTEQKKEKKTEKMKNKKNMKKIKMIKK